MVGSMQSSEAMEWHFLTEKQKSSSGKDQFDTEVFVCLSLANTGYCGTHP
jgi:hypothetical protein